MKALMYRHGPAVPALVGAFASLMIGASVFLMIYPRVQSGEIGEDKLSAVILVSLLVFSIFLIGAFARYRFTHLWLSSYRKTRRRQPSHTHSRS